MNLLWRNRLTGARHIGEGALFSNFDSEFDEENRCVSKTTYKKNI